MRWVSSAWGWAVCRILDEWAWVRIWVRRYWKPLDETAGVEEVERWANDYTAPRDVEDDAYEIARDNAVARYEEVLRVSEGLDKKLEDLARTALTVGGIVATLSKVTGVQVDEPSWRLIAGGVIVAVFAVATSFLARRPVDTSMPYDARTVLEIADLDPPLPERKIKATAAVSYHVATIAMISVTEWKARQLRLATWAFCLSLVMFSIAVVRASAPVVPPTHPSDQPRPQPAPAPPARHTSVGWSERAGRSSC